MRKDNPGGCSSVLFNASGVGGSLVSLAALFLCFIVRKVFLAAGCSGKGVVVAVCVTNVEERCRRVGGCVILALSSV